MRKLKLEIDTLKVESFAADPHAPPRAGTVRGHVAAGTPVTTDDDEPWYRSWWYSCEPRYTEGTCMGPSYCCPPTWEPTCNPSCDASCEIHDCGA